MQGTASRFSLLASRLLVPRLPLERDHCQSRRDHRKGPGEQSIRHQEESEERQRGRELGNPEDGTHLGGNRGQDHQVPLEPERAQRDQGEEREREW